MSEYRPEFRIGDKIEYCGEVLTVVANNGAGGYVREPAGSTVIKFFWEFDGEKSTLYQAKHVQLNVGKSYYFRDDKTARIGKVTVKDIPVLVCDEGSETKIVEIVATWPNGEEFKLSVDDFVNQVFDDDLVHAVACVYERTVCITCGELEHPDEMYQGECPFCRATVRKCGESVAVDEKYPDRLVFLEDVLSGMSFMSFCRELEIGFLLLDLPEDEAEKAYQAAKNGYKRGCRISGALGEVAKIVPIDLEDADVREKRLAELHTV